MNSNKTILFDLDGTLFDTGPDFEFIINEMLAKRNMPALNYPSFRTVISAGTLAMIQHAFQNKESDENYDELIKEFRENYWQLMGQRAQLFPGIKALLNTLNKEKVQWGIVSNRMEAYIKPFLQKFSLAEQPACMVGADTTEHRKPHPAPLLHAAKLLHVNPENCFYVGDYIIDIEAAKAASMSCIAVTWGYSKNKQQLEKLMPNFVVDHPKNILDIINQS